MPYKDNTLTQEQLDEIVRQHNLWLESDGTKGKRADLSGQILIGLNFENANLLGANLLGANLQEANLRGVGLPEAMNCPPILGQVKNLSQTACSSWVL